MDTPWLPTPCYPKTRSPRSSVTIIYHIMHLPLVDKLSFPVTLISLSHIGQLPFTFISLSLPLHPPNHFKLYETLFLNTGCTRIP
jgi:hypothetical protein